MARIDLQVPFDDKDDAKRLGARWDAGAQVWYVPEDVDAGPLARWLPPDDAVNVRAAEYFIAASTRACWRCAAITAVHGFLLPAGHETLSVGDEPDEDVWERSDEPSLLCYLGYLPAGVVARIHAVTACYRIAHSRTTGSFYWMNLCEYCGAKLGDYETFCEPGQGFLAFTSEDAARITLTRIAAPFTAHCGSFSIGVALFDEMRVR